MIARPYLDDDATVHAVELDDAPPTHPCHPWPYPAATARCGRDRTELHPLQTGDLTWRVQYGPLAAGADTVPLRITLTKPEDAVMCPTCLAEGPDREPGFPRTGSREVPLNHVPANVLAGLIAQVIDATAPADGNPT